MYQLYLDQRYGCQAPHIYGRVPSWRLSAAAVSDLDELMQAMELWEAPGDGLCLFSSLGLHIGQEALALRAEVVKFMSTHALEQGDMAAHWLEESEALREDPGLYGGHTSITAFSAMVGKKVIIHDVLRNYKIDASHPAVHEGEPIHLIFNGRDHYDTLREPEVMSTPASPPSPQEPQHEGESGSDIEERPALPRPEEPPQDESGLVTVNKRTPLATYTIRIREILGFDEGWPEKIILETVQKEFPKIHPSRLRHVVNREHKRYHNKPAPKRVAGKPVPRQLAARTCSACGSLLRGRGRGYCTNKACHVEQPKHDVKRDIALLEQTGVIQWVVDDKGFRRVEFASPISLATKIAELQRQKRMAEAETARNKEELNSLRFAP